MAKKKKKLQAPPPKDSVSPFIATGPWSLFDGKVIDAAKAVGLDESQIASYQSEQTLKEFLYQVDPTLRLKLEPPPEVHAPKPEAKPIIVDKVETFSLAIDAWMTHSANHASMEEMQIQSQLRAKQIRDIQSISIVRSFVPDKKGKLISQVTVNYKGGQ